ncbi:MAG: hypothetical protein AABX10_04715 [Nanoarchaeota archaeon]
MTNEQIRIECIVSRCIYENRGTKEFPAGYVEIHLVNDEFPQIAILTGRYVPHIQTKQIVKITGPPRKLKNGLDYLAVEKLEIKETVNGLTLTTFHGESE